MLVETENLKSVEQLSEYFHEKLGIAKSYFPTLIYRGKVSGAIVTIHGRDFYVIDPDADDWGIKLDVKATKKK
jgi:hypothetical protein